MTALRRLEMGGETRVGRPALSLWWHLREEECCVLELATNTETAGEIQDRFRSEEV